MGKEEIRISVRNLIEFILRSGDIDNRHGGVSDKEAMQKGSKIHRKIQRQMGSSYQAEVSLSYESVYEKFVICVEGRADGIFTENEEVYIDEIKGVYLDVDRLEEPIGIHEAQAMCYGYMYCCREHLEGIGIQLTYCQLETERIQRFRKEYSFSYLEEWYEKLVDAYSVWIDFQTKWKEIRNTSMENLEFPFAYREGQKKIVTGVYHTISERKQLFIQAPTGIGKTMSVIYPSVRAVGEGKGEKIFYLTAKTVTRTVACEAFEILKAKGLCYKVVLITAKEKICPQESMECNPLGCPYAKGHYDRVNDAVFDLLQHEDAYDQEVLLAYAEKWQVCPFEMCLDTATWADAVICDYNYVFDPNVHLRRFFGEGNKGDYLFLIDEAHNLVDRGREMYSAQICKEDVLEMKRLLKPHSPKLGRILEKINRQLLEYKRECEEYVILPNAGALPLSFMNLMGELDAFMEENPGRDFQEKLLEFYFAVRDFLNISELVDENYVVYSELQRDQKFYVRLFCVNPAGNIQNCLDKGSAAVFFSATLLPMNYYRSLLCTVEQNYAICARSPFQRKNRCLLIGNDVSSKYTRRGYEEYEKIAEYIYRTAQAKKGNYMIFFPSYKFMQEVYEIYQQKYMQEEVSCICQQTSMTEGERESFLREFENIGHQKIGFCVMGGIFAEGIDLTGEQLIGTVVVGTGIPQISNEREILKNYYNTHGKNGFDYAYRYPGMNKVLQAAGRVIRTQEDRGVIVLLDERFRQYEYQILFPEEWNDYIGCRRENITQYLERFWMSME